MKKETWCRVWLLTFALVVSSILTHYRVIMFVSDPDEDLWYIAAERDLSFVNKIKVHFLLKRGADLSYEVGGTTPFGNALQQRNYELLSLMSEYVSDSEKQYALRFAETEGDAELLIFLRSNFEY